MNFELTSRFTPTGDQPESIEALVKGLKEGLEHQVLLGVTGSGKTFTIANVIAEINRPTLVLSHNKTLAAQLYNEFNSFFPKNAVEYFVSYYDYYQPEAYIPTTDTYIEKDLAINDEIDKLRLRTTASLLSGRRDVVVVSSVSCLYSMADPRAFAGNTIKLRCGERVVRNKLLRSLIDGLYVRNDIEFKRGTFRTKGEVVDIFPAIESYDGIAYRLEFWDDEIERISSFNPTTGDIFNQQEELIIYPANLFVTTKDAEERAIEQIQKDLAEHIEYMREIGKPMEAKRLEERVNYDVEMIRELGYCPGIENYSRYFDGRAAGVRPYCLLDYFPDDFLLVVDESHVTIPQVRAMFGGDHARKSNLVEYGFRLPAAFDNRPLTFNEFEELTHQTIYVSATPAEYELMHTEGVVVEQIIRPTGIPDPEILVVPTKNQIDHLVNEINTRSERGERVLVTTLTKKMAEELSTYFENIGFLCQYIHSDVETLERVKILENLRSGAIDVVVGVNLLREGLDLPEVSLVAILDADKEGFLRCTRSLTQTAGRAARHLNGTVIMYADHITRSMQETIDDTRRRREKQLAYNKEHNITPRQIVKENSSILTQNGREVYVEEESIPLNDPVVEFMSKGALEKLADKTHAAMLKASKSQDYLEAARLRDEWMAIKERAEKIS